MLDEIRRIAYPVDLYIEELWVWSILVMPLYSWSAFDDLAFTPDRCRPCW